MQDRSFGRDAWAVVADPYATPGLLRGLARYIAQRSRWELPPRAEYETVVEVRDGGDHAVDRLHVTRRGESVAVCGVPLANRRRLRVEWGKEFESMGPHWGPKVRSRFPRCEDCALKLPVRDF